MTYLNHINGKKHQRKLGMSMRVRRSTVEEIQERIRWNVERKAKERLRQQETIHDRMRRRDKEFSIRKKKRGGRKVQANRQRREKYLSFMDQKLQKLREETLGSVAGDETVGAATHTQESVEEELQRAMERANDLQDRGIFKKFIENSSDSEVDVEYNDDVKQRTLAQGIESMDTPAKLDTTPVASPST
uniref:Zinc finger matrin-type protein 2 n=2 Tax=Lygus hesperus TaxID=30085 RepID=A0A0A9YT97_LYGHE